MKALSVWEKRTPFFQKSHHPLSLSWSTCVSILWAQEHLVFKLNYHLFWVFSHANWSTWEWHAGRDVFHENYTLLLYQKKIITCHQFGLSNDILASSFMPEDHHRNFNQNDHCSANIRFVSEKGFVISKSQRSITQLLRDRSYHNYLESSRCIQGASHQFNSLIRQVLRLDFKNHSITKIWFLRSQFCLQILHLIGNCFLFLITKASVDNE